MSAPPATAAGHLGLRDLFLRTVSALQPALPFDLAELALLQDRERVHSVSLGFDTYGAPRETAAARGDYSPRLWSEEAGRRDATADLDPAHAADRRFLEAGARSILAVPLRLAERQLGLLALASRSDAAFQASPMALLGPVVEVLAIAAEHERLWALEARRQQRRERLEGLLKTLAEALDVRQVFLGMSQVVQEIVPHDVLAFALLTPDRGGVRVQAATHRGMLEMPEYRFSNPEEALDSNWRFLLAYDLEPAGEGLLRVRITPRGVSPPQEVVVRPGGAWASFVAQAGVRSTMRVPIRAKERPIGGVVFMSRQPDSYDEEDGAVAARIADHLALALAHQELAEEERRIAQAEERAAILESRVEVLSRELERFSAHRALGQSAAWKKVLADATQVAATDTTVLITGESGTGKEVVARYLHRGSPRARGSFVALNCAALPEQLLESELFGHERGAFTGALQARPGKIEQAQGGVLFLDEVGEMSPLLQAKFLRVLQEREYQRLGGTKTLRADVRIVAATNRDPRRAIESGAFREDLYYRLSVFEIRLPPLRERSEDILVLAEAFLEEIGATVGRPAAGLSEDAREQLLAHAWPGNVRELRNAIERAVILCHGGLVTREHLPLALARPPAPDVTPSLPRPPDSTAPEVLRLAEVERDMLQKALARARNNKSQAARLLGLSRGAFYSLLRKHGLTDARR